MFNIFLFVIILIDIFISFALLSDINKAINDLYILYFEILSNDNKIDFDFKER